MRAAGLGSGCNGCNEITHLDNWLGNSVREDLVSDCEVLRSLVKSVIEALLNGTSGLAMD